MTHVHILVATCSRDGCIQAICPASRHQEACVHLCNNSEDEGWYYHVLITFLGFPLDWRPCAGFGYAMLAAPTLSILLHLWGLPGFSPPLGFLHVVCAGILVCSSSRSHQGLPLFQCSLIVSCLCSLLVPHTKPLPFPPHYYQSSHLLL